MFDNKIESIPPYPTVVYPHPSGACQVLMGEGRRWQADGEFGLALAAYARAELIAKHLKMSDYQRQSGELIDSLNDQVRGTLTEDEVSYHLKKAIGFGRAFREMIARTISRRSRKGVELENLLIQRN